LCSFVRIKIKNVVFRGALNIIQEIRKTMSKDIEKAEKSFLGMKMK